MAARKKPDGEPETLKAHIQARLHEHNPDGGRERDAIQFYQSEELTAHKWDDRRIVTEALLALRMYWEKGYRPPDNPQGLLSMEILAIVKEARRALKMARKHMEMLNTLDLSSLRTQSGWKEDVYQQTSNVINKNAAAIMGNSKVYDDEEDDDFQYVELED